MQTYFQGRCKTLYCPNLSVAVNGKCIPYIDYEQSYRLAVKLVPVEKVNKSRVIKGEMTDKIQIIKRKLGFQLCELCVGFLDINHTHEYDLRYIRIYLDLKQAKGCTIEFIWSKITLIERTTTKITLVVDKRKILFNAFGDFENTLFLYPNIPCKLILDGGPGSYCSKISLTDMEYESVLKNNPNNNDLLFIPNKDDNDKNKTMLVCVDGYIREERSNAGGGSHVYHCPFLLLVFFALS